MARELEGAKKELDKLFPHGFKYGGATMRERQRDIRRRRQRREKRLKARIHELVAHASSNLKKKPTAVVEETLVEKKIIHRKPAAKASKKGRE